MTGKRRPRTTTLLFVAAQVGILVWLELTFRVSALARGAMLQGAPLALEALGAFVPSAFGTSVAVLGTHLGLGGLYQHIVGPSPDSGSGGPSTLGAAIVAPLLSGLRRWYANGLSDRGHAHAPRPPPPETSKAKAFEPPAATSTGVQESL